ncbi:hypothetical protein GCM10011578_067700 [Streptomyces fuscichromogenes]|uniref:Uncharacterized protein n=1 Tax=Streptomyces fuscichromogenes TaxID=1324013 RepID=A0A917XIM6_9ACTN|nr:hypothetical protein GCM10011578_067700 [Streptomyces fuscichromogenes]
MPGDLADPGTGAVHGGVAADGDVNGSHLIHTDLPRNPSRAFFSAVSSGEIKSPSTDSGHDEALAESTPPFTANSR